MQASSTNASLMLGGHEVTYSWTVQIDLPGGIYPDVTLGLSAVELDFSTTTDQPDGTRLQEGYAAGQATFTLAGQLTASDATQTAAWLFGRYSATSPLYHSDAFMCPVRIYFNVYTSGSLGTPEQFREFTGYVEDYTQDDDGNVSFTCLDGRQLLRSVPNLPAVVPPPAYSAALTSGFAVDALLRAATGGWFSTWPAQPTGCVASIGFRSSLMPETGTLSSVYGAQPTFMPGVYGPAYAGLPTNQTLSYSTAAPVGRAIGMSMIVTAQTSVARYDGLTVEVFGAALQYLELVYTGSSIILDVPGNINAVIVSTSLSTPTTVELAMNLPAVGGTSYTGTLWVNGVATTVNVTGDARTSASWSGLNVFQPDNLSGYTLEALQVANVAPTSSRYPFIPTASIDPSLNPLQIVPAMSGDPWTVIQQIAAAELAIARFDESTGNFTYRNRDTIASTPVARTVASTASLETIGGVESTYASIVNDANVGYTTYSFASAVTRLWSAPVPRKVPAGGSYTFNVMLSEFAAVNLDITVQNLPNGTTDQTQSWYRASTDKAGLNEFQGTLSFAVSQSAPNQIAVVVSNPSKQVAWLVSPANYTDMTVGTPVLYISGQQVTQNAEQTANYQFPPLGEGGALSSRWGDIAWNGTGNPWIQDPDAAAQLASDVVVANYLPLPNFTGLSIAPDPRIQLTDKVLVDDTLRTGVVEFVQVFGYTISWQADGDSFTHSIDGRVIAPPGGGLIGYGSDVTSFATRNVIGAGSTPGSLYIAS